METVCIIRAELQSFFTATVVTTAYMDPFVAAGLSGVLLAVLYLLFQRTFSSESADAHGGLPWADLRDEVFKTTRSSLRQLTSCSQVLLEGYKKYGKSGQPFVVSDASFQPQVMLPQEDIQWLTTQPETILSVWPVRSKRRALGAMITTVEHKSTIAFMDKIVGRFLTRNLASVQVDVADEIKATVDSTLGLDEHSWHEMNLVQTFQTLGDRSGIRALFGLTLCRDQHFVRVLNHYKVLMGIGIFLSGQLPPIIRPIVGVLLVLPFRVCKARAIRVLTPVIKRCMREVGNEDTAPKNAPHDFLTGSIRAIMKDRHNPYRNDAKYIADQFLVLSFATLASIALVAGNLFLDILSTPESLDLYAQLRSDAANAFDSEADWADPAALKKMMLTDSVIRESIRFSSIQVRGLLRAVVAEDGVTLPNGTHVARGTWIGVPVEAVHMDERFYKKPFQYDPFRFVRIRSESVDGQAKVDATEISDTFLGWSYGRFACPGRWFAVQNMKLMVAYITLNYDIQSIDKRPPSTVFGDANIPSMSAYIRVRRRANAALSPKGSGN